MSSDYGVIDANSVAAWNDEADIVIVGLGCAGVCAAIEAWQRLADWQVSISERDPRLRACICSVPRPRS